MIKSIIIAVLSSFLLLSCESNQNSGDEMTYSFACLDSTVSGSELNKTLEKAGDIIRDITVSEEDITDQVQTEYGEAFHQDAIESKTFKILNDVRINTDLTTVMNELLKVRENPSAIVYKIYALDDASINAFTFGGRIYVTKAMYEKCKGKTALLYAIVGHEIGHSEKGHIKRTIQDMMVANKVFGEQNGTTAFQVIRTLTGSFNQKNELEADYYGTDLTYNLNEDVCAAVLFWREMSEQENQYNRMEDFFRSHPFSSLRAQCLQSHIEKNFNRNCQAGTTAMQNSEMD
jgi:beta-barrel assembly-enhancing protease